MQQVITFQIVKSIRAMHLMIQPHHSRSKSIFPIQCIEFSKQFGWAPTREVFDADEERPTSTILQLGFLQTFEVTNFDERHD